MNETFMGVKEERCHACQMFTENDSTHFVCEGRRIIGKISNPNTGGRDTLDLCVGLYQKGCIFEGKQELLELFGLKR